MVRAIALLLLVAGCEGTYTVRDPDIDKVIAICHGDMQNSFCRVEQPKGTTLTTGTGIVGAIGSATVTGVLSTKP